MVATAYFFSYFPYGATYFSYDVKISMMKKLIQLAAPSYCAEGATGV